MNLKEQGTERTSETLGKKKERSDGDERAKRAKGGVLYFFFWQYFFLPNSALPPISVAVICAPEHLSDSAMPQWATGGLINRLAPFGRRPPYQQKLGSASHSHKMK